MSAANRWGCRCTRPAVAEVGEAAEDQAAIPKLLSAVLRLQPHCLTFQPARADRSERTVAARENRRLQAAAGGT